MKSINQLHAIGFFGSMDVQIADLAKRMVPDTHDAALLAAALASRAISLGHACANLTDYAGKSWREILAVELLKRRDAEDSEIDESLHDETINAIPPPPASLADWLQALNPALFGTGTEKVKNRTLFVQKGGRVYLRRYFDYERKVEEKLIALKAQSTKNRVSDDELSRYFREDQDIQKNAARNAIERRLSLLSGGPGTGKTYTLARAAALLSELKPKDTELAIRMVAPTGKAAVRMVESIKKAKKELRDALLAQGKSDEHLKAIPEAASTIHRLLGSHYHSPYFKHDAANPIQADMVIVDEASMVDLPLMAKLLDALPSDCALMLVGDTDQLASVEPGRVYGDVCHAAEANGPLDGCLTRLTKSWRFPDDSVIGKISRLVNEGQSDTAWQALSGNGKSTHLQLMDAAHLNDKDQDFITLATKLLRPFVAAKDATSALKEASNFRILCALRKGPQGVNTMNHLVENILLHMGLKPGRGIYDHQLIMIKVNTPSLNLYNGDVGIVLEKECDKNAFEVWFPDPETGNVREHAIPVGLLPEHETAFAMTIHKSQGSEFPHVALILPASADSPILTRELLYTGMTRVAIDPEEHTGRLTMWCTEQSFKTAVTLQTARATGLFKSTINS